MKNLLLFSLLIALLSQAFYTKAQNSNSPTLLGYNIYRNNEKINTELINSTEFIDQVPTNDSYSYYIKAVYSEGESGSSNTKEVIIDTNFVNKQYVVFEKGTGTWCSYCPGAALGLDDLIEKGKKVLGIAYHHNDDYANKDAANRNDFYNIQGYPTAIFDGINVSRGGSATQSLYDSYLPYYEERIDLPTHYAIGITGNKNDSSYIANITIEKIGTHSANNLKLMSVIIEDHIEKSWLGLEELNAVARKMLPDSDGLSIEFDTDLQHEKQITFTTEDVWVDSNCTLICFIQNMDTKEIYQGAKLKLNDFTLKNKKQKKAINQYLPCPYNLKTNYSLYKTNVSLSWEIPASERWVQYDSGESRTIFGSNAEPLVFDAAIMFLPNDIVALEGLSISKVGFYPCEPSCAYSIKIWEGDNAEDLVKNLPLENVNTNEWNDIELDHAVKINSSKKLWVGYHNENTKNRRSAGCDDGPLVDGFGNKIRLYNNNVAKEWQNLTDLDFTTNWNIRFFVEYIEEATSIYEQQENEKPSIHIYPNPAKEMVSIVANEKIETLYVINTRGQVIFKNEPNTISQTLNLSSYKPGVYYIKIETTKGFSFKKLIIQ